jgi:ribokinase
MLGGTLAVGSGGKGGNQAVAAAYAGVPTAMVGCVGDDADGQALIADLRAAGVDTSGVVVPARVRTGTAFVFVAADGENSIVVAPGANAELSEQQVRDALAGLPSGRVVVTQAEIPLPAMSAALETASHADSRPVLNLAPYRNVPPDVLALADPLVVNSGEAGLLLGRQVTNSLDDVARAADSLRARSRSVVVTAGAGGAVVADGQGQEHVPAVEAQVIDSTGAGDAFTGVLAAALSLGHDLHTAARWGVAAGTFAVARPGAQASYPRGADLVTLVCGGRDGTGESPRRT